MHSKSHKWRQSRSKYLNVIARLQFSARIFEINSKIHRSSHHKDAVAIFIA
jgi:hypothetical protein